MEVMASAVPPFPPQDSIKDEPMEPKGEELEPKEEKPNVNGSVEMRSRLEILELALTEAGTEAFKNALFECGKELLLHANGVQNLLMQQFPKGE